MKKNSVWWTVLAVLIVVAAIIMSNQLSAHDSSTIDTGASDRAPSAEQQPPASVPQPDPDNTESPASKPQPPAATLTRPMGATRSEVAYVHDGDTLYLQPEGTHSRDDQIKVRLIGIDTPEIGDYRECFGYEARDYLRQLLPEGTDVWIMPDREEFDRHGRSLLYLWTMDDRSVNLDLVRNGYALALNIAPSNTYWQQFDAAEAAARNAGAGLWGSC